MIKKIIGQWVVPLFLKIFKNVIHDQLSHYLEKYLSSLLCGFWKAHSSQPVLFKLLQTWQEELDKYGFMGTIVNIEYYTIYYIFYHTKYWYKDKRIFNCSLTRSHNW